MRTVREVTDFLHRFAPLPLAAAWDNVGLLLGDPATSVQRVMTCLTVTPDSAAEAIAEGVHLIVSHHPILFRPIQRLTAATPEGRTILGLARAGVAVCSPHTAFDNTTGGINDQIARLLQLSDVRPLRRREGPSQYKIVVFTPDADLGRVSDALFAAGAGQIGQYSQCSFRLAGTGTFYGSENTNPTVGRKGRREEVSEWRLEAVCSEGSLGQAVAAMRKAHSYEEPAYDIYPLRGDPGSAGEGRLGCLPQPAALGELGRVVKTALRSSLIQVVGDPGRSVAKVAIVCGAGGELLADAIRAEADVFLTGEMRFHDYLTAQAQGIGLLLPGHYATERPAVEVLAGHIQAHFADLQVWASRRECDPVHLL